VLDFVWMRPQVGRWGHKWGSLYKLVKGPVRSAGGPLDCTGHVLVRLQTRVDEGPYRPLDDPAFFLVFADLHEKEDRAFESFANRYGSLTNLGDCEVGVEARVPVPIPSPAQLVAGKDPAESGRVFQFVPGERLDVWRRWAWRVRELVDCWNLVRRRDRKALRERFTWDPDPKAPAGGSWCLRSPSVPVEPDDRDDLSSSDDVILVASVFLSTALSRFLSAGLHLRPVISIDKAPSWQIGVRPKTLIDAILTQLAFAIAGSANFGSCSSCGNWFARPDGRWFLGPKVKRRDAAYCGDSCRQRAKRRRDRDQGR
jgi:hypothetical protein